MIQITPEDQQVNDGTMQLHRERHTYCGQFIHALGQSRNVQSLKGLAGIADYVRSAMCTMKRSYAITNSPQCWLEFYSHEGFRTLTAILGQPIVDLILVTDLMNAWLGPKNLRLTFAKTWQPTIPWSTILPHGGDTHDGLVYKQLPALTAGGVVYLAGYIAYNADNLASKVNGNNRSLLFLARCIAECLALEIEYCHEFHQPPGSQAYLVYLQEPAKWVGIMFG